MKRDKQGFGERLKKFLKSRQIKYREAAEILHVTPTAISEWVSEKNRPSVHIMQILAESYKLSTTWLITGRGNMLSVDDESPKTLQNNEAIDSDNRIIKDLSDQLKNAHIKLIDCQETLIELQKKCIECPKKRKED